ncbi:glyco protein hormone beta-5, partial [Trichinella spiralis]|uniref:glyco protein hormone beta-5 n=1 Tax=Trichinella spiralis TaxID=6334 RepID=UPI0001EFCF16
MTVLRNPSETCRIIAEIYYCPVHYPKFCRIVYPQYRYQYLCTASLNSPTNLLSNGELLKPNYRVSINHVTCGSVLTVSNVTDAFSVWLNFNFCTSLNLFYLSLVGIVGNAYIDLTKEERQYISTAMTPQDIDVIETKKLYSRIHSHRKMHRLLTTLWPSNKCVRNHAVFGCR